jgi:hypothetical protein
MQNGLSMPWSAESGAQLYKLGPCEMQDDIEFYDSVFNEEFCKYLYRDALKALSSGREFTRSNFQWQPEIVKVSTAVLVRDYDRVMSNIILQQLCDRGVIENHNYHVMNYVWSRLSYIPWHHDDKRRNAITIYLNEYWDHNWGGIYLYYTDPMHLKGYLPKFNTAIKNSNTLVHSTTIISMDAESPRVTIQLFTKSGE